MARTPPDRRFPSLGFTLAEALTTVAVLCVITAASLPSLAAVIQRHRVIATGNALVTDLNLARSHAITRREPVSVCPSSDMTRCRTDKDWTTGWIVFMAPNGKRQPDTSDAIVWATQRQTSAENRVLASAGRDLVRYLPDGRSSGTNLTLRICTSDGVASQIVVNNAGRIRTERNSRPSPCDRP